MGTKVAVYLVIVTDQICKNKQNLHKVTRRWFPGCCEKPGGYCSDYSSECVWLKYPHAKSHCQRTKWFSWIYNSGSQTVGQEPDCGGVLSQQQNLTQWRVKCPEAGRTWLLLLRYTEVTVTSWGSFINTLLLHLHEYGNSMTYLYSYLSKKIVTPYTSEFFSS